MLRVGLSLPQCAHNPVQPLFAILSCSPQFHPSIPFQARLVSRFTPRSSLASEVSEVNDTAQDVKDRSEPLENPKQPLNPKWKWMFPHEMKARKTIRVLRPSRGQPKYASYKTPANTVENHIEQGASGIIIHPLHRPCQKIQSDLGIDPSMEKLLPSKLRSRAFTKPAQADPWRGQSRDALLQIMAETQSVSEAWKAYSTLLVMHKPGFATYDAANPSHSENVSNSLVIPHAHLHRLAALLASTHPRTRQLFLHLLSVLTTLRTTGGPIFVWEWNALMDSAGKGWRKTRIEDYRAALGIFKDMVTSGRAVSSMSSIASPVELGDASLPDRRPVAQPDIITFTTLLDIASRTLTNDAILHATSLLMASELPWNNVTHMARLPYFIHTNQLDAVRGILRTSVNRGLDLYTLNGCLWAYASKGRLRMALQVYDLLRRNVPANERVDFGKADSLPLSVDPASYEAGQEQHPFFSLPGFVPQATMPPDAVTYTLLIQALCYHGDLIGALTLFRDMVSTVDPALRLTSSQFKEEHDVTSTYYKPSLAVYRAIFLGFARHAHQSPRTLAASLISKRQGIDVVPLPEFAARLTASDPRAGVRSPPPEAFVKEIPWTLENLEKIFENFLETDWVLVSRIGDAEVASNRPSDRMIYWIMVAYAKTTQRDLRKMYGVWKQLDARFQYGHAGRKWSGRLGRIADELERQHRQPSNDDYAIDPQ